MASRPLAMSGVRPVTVAVTLCLVAFGWITWRECGAYRDKLTLYHQTMRRSPNASLIAHNLASYYYNIDDLARAEEWETKALAGWQQSYAKNTAGLALIHAGFGNVRFKQGRIDEARDYIMKASQEAPLYDELLQNIGIFYVGVGDYPKALEFFQSAARLNPNLEIAFSNIAGIYAMYDKWDLAIANARKALSINPSHADAWLNLAFACAGKGMKEEARQAYVKLKELDPARSALVDSELKALSSR
jgi:tetratricopeptide (TPR) repeat protein